MLFHYPISAKLFSRNTYLIRKLPLSLSPPLSISTIGVPLLLTIVLYFANRRRGGAPEYLPAPLYITSSDKETDIRPDNRPPARLSCLVSVMLPTIMETLLCVWTEINTTTHDDNGKDVSTNYHSAISN